METHTTLYQHIRLYTFWHGYADCAHCAGWEGREIWMDRNNVEVRADRDYVPASFPSGCVAMEVRANLLERAATQFVSGFYRMGGTGRNGTPKEGIRLVDR